MVLQITQEVVRAFVRWTKVKIQIHHKPDEEINSLYFKEREIWWAHLGQNVGFEENGKNEAFDRPVIVLKKFNQHFLWAVPTSTKIKSSNPYYFLFHRDDHRYSALVSQIRPMSSKRLIRKIGKIPKPAFAQLLNRIFDILKNDSRVSF